MTNDEGNPNDEAPRAMTGATLTISSFVLRHSFVIRHSCFVISVTW
jgi:hypothetical protein